MIVGDIRPARRKLRLGIWRLDADRLKPDMAGEAANRQSIDVNLVRNRRAGALDVGGSYFEPAAGGSRFPLENVSCVGRA